MLTPSCFARFLLSFVARRHDYVELLLNDSDLRTALYETHMKKIPDVDSIVAKLQDAKSNRKADTTIQLLVQMYTLLDRVPGIVGCLRAHDSPLKPMVEEEFILRLEREILDEIAGWTEMVVTTVDLDATKNHEFKVGRCARA